MKRRGFLGRLLGLAAAPLLANVEFVNRTPQGMIPDQSPLVLGANGTMYRYVHALTPLKKGDAIFWDGKIIGVATCDIDRSNYGWAQLNHMPLKDV